MMDSQGRTVVVCDNGSQFLRYGLAEDYSPIYKFPTVVGHPKSDEELVDPKVKAFMFGEDALKSSSVVDISYPIKNGIVQNWEDMTLLWEHIFSLGLLEMNPRNTKLFLTESPFNDVKNREKMLEIMFEKFDFNSIFIGNRAAATLFSLGVTSGVVVELGDGVTDICPVQFYPIKSLTKRINSSNSRDISEVIFNTIRAADPKIQKELVKRIVIVADSNIASMDVQDKIKKLFLKHETDAEKPNKLTIRVDFFPIDNDKSFAGGAVLANVNKDKSEFWMTKASYQDAGNRISL